MICLCKILQNHNPCFDIETVDSNCGCSMVKVGAEVVSIKNNISRIRMLCPVSFIWEDEANELRYGLQATVRFRNRESQFLR